MSLKSFFEWFGSEFKKLFGKAPTIAQSAKALISYAAPIVETIVGFAAGTAAETAVANVVNIVQADLATVSAVAQQATVAAGSTAEQTVLTALNSIKTNFAGLLQVAEVKNSARASEITAAADGLIGEVDALIENIGGGSVPAAPAAGSAS